MKGVTNKRGFTLIEILVVIGLIAILAAIVLIAINPARQFAQGRNAQRTSNVNAVLNAVGQNLADNKGIFTCAGVGTPIDGTVRHIGTTAGLVDLTCLTPTYIPSLPMDPNGGAVTDTDYTITVDANGRYSVCAPNSITEHEISNPGPTICVTR
jgi:prepilin-type N-terminal cleavage/methylation domain-containing protein